MSNKVFNKPDVTAPRYRETVHQVTTDKFFKAFKEKYPKYEDIKDSELKKVIKAFNILFWETVVDTRDGVQLPEELGYVFVGTCQTSKKTNIDFGKSNKYGFLVTNNNWDTDGKLAKIFYTNDANKYKFVNRECWAFQGCRNFKRTVAKTYPENWNMYTEVTPTLKIKLAYSKALYKNYKAEETTKALKTYNEFDL